MQEQARKENGVPKSRSRVIQQSGSEISGEDGVEEGSGAGRERPQKHTLASQPHAAEHRRGQLGQPQGPPQWLSQLEQKEMERRGRPARRGIEDANYLRTE